MAVNATTAAQPDQDAASSARRKMAAAVQRELRVYQHSNLLYWWVVWAYGFVCAALTYAQGLGIKELAASDRKEILFYRSPWLGISFVVLLLFVVVFTNVRVRGI